MCQPKKIGRSKDGGKFDQFSGATITPRATVNQVKRSALVMLENEALLNEMAKNTRNGIFIMADLTEKTTALDEQVRLKIQKK